MDEHDQIDVRLRALEARVSGLEARVGHQSPAAGSAGPEPAAGAGPRAPIVAPQPQPQPQPPVPVARPPVARPNPGWGEAWVAPARSTASATAATTIGSAAAPGAPAWGAVIADLEERLTGRALAVVGGVALVAGAIFFLSLAFSRGWIGPEGRVLIGIAAAGVALAIGAWTLDHRQATVGTVLVAVGLAVASLSLFAATRLYGLVPVEIALLGTLVASIAAAFLSVRNDSQVIAVFALIAILGAPPVLGAEPGLVTIAFLGTVLAGFAALALVRTWRWLPGIAFLLSAPQLASWLTGHVEPGVGLLAAVAFWLLNAIVAGGEEYLRPRNRLRAGGAVLLVANAAYLVWAGFAVLDPGNEVLRGPFLLAVALAHLVLGSWFLLRDGDRHPFGLLAAGTGIAALAMAVPVQAGGPPVPIAWAAEAAVLAWIAARRAHPQALLAAAVLGSLALIHVLVFEYPAGSTMLVASAPDWPFVNASGLTLAFVGAAAALAAWFVRARSIVATIAALVVLAAGFAIPHELSGPPRIGVWVVLALGALAFDRFVLPRLPEAGPIPLPDVFELRFTTLAAAAVVAMATLGDVFTQELPIAAFGTTFPPAVPFSDERALTIAFLVLGAGISGWVYLRRLTLELPAIAGLVGAAFILSYGGAFEVHADAAIVIAAGLSAAGFVLATRTTIGSPSWLLATGASLVMAAFATTAALTVVARPGLLAVANVVVAAHPPFISSATVGCAAVVLALGLGSRLNRGRGFAPWIGLAAGTVAVYALSIGVVGLFQMRVPGSVAFEEVAKQAQVAMSVLWIVLGAAVFVFGLARRHLIVRQAGLGLLAIASLKVFAFDLAALDVAYRVLSLVALGTFLLITAWVYGRFRPPASTRVRAADEDGSPA